VCVSGRCTIAPVNTTILIFVTALLLLTDAKLSCALQLETLIQEDRLTFQLNSKMRNYMFIVVYRNYSFAKKRNSKCLFVILNMKSFVHHI
jgi:hypothetical protein